MIYILYTHVNILTKNTIQRTYEYTHIHEISSGGIPNREFNLGPHNLLPTLHWNTKQLLPDKPQSQTCFPKPDSRNPVPGKPKPWVPFSYCYGGKSFQYPSPPKRPEPSIHEESPEPSSALRTSESFTSNRPCTSEPLQLAMLAGSRNALWERGPNRPGPAPLQKKCTALGE